MSLLDRTCWECGRLAPSGVCTGPHPGYSHERAVGREFVIALDGIVTATLFGPHGQATWEERPLPEPRTCVTCGREFEPWPLTCGIYSRSRTCSGTCARARQSEQARIRQRRAA